MKKINVAVVGLGYWGPNILRNLYKIPDVKVEWICDIDQKKLSLASNNYPTAEVTEEYMDILTDELVNLVVIATPLKTHYKLAKACILAGKNILIEKPMVSSVRQAKDLISIAKKMRKQIFVGHTFVYSEPVRFLKKMLEKNTLGKIYYFDSTRINLGLLQEDSNVLWDLAPHDISIISYLFPNKPISVMAVGSFFLRKNIEEIVHLFITLENNVTCHMQLSWLSPVKIRNITITGSKKMVTYDDIEPTEKIKIYDKSVVIKKSDISPFSPAYRSGDIILPKISQTEPLLNELTHFIDCLRNGKKPITGGSEGLEVIKVIEASEKSLRTKKAVLIND